MRSELKKLQRRLGVTTIYVTHDQVEAMTMGDRIAVMNKGRIRQVGPPHEVYNRPADTFVATFIGSPQMNLLPARIEEGPQGPQAVAGPLRIPLHRNPGAEKVLVGVRPEHISLTPSSDAVEAEAVIDFVERLGSDTILHLQLGSETITVKLAGDHPYRQGEKVKIYIPRDKILVYDARTGELLAGV